MRVSERWETSQFELRSLQLTDEFSAVVAEERNDGTFFLVKLPLCAIGIAKVTDRVFVDDGSGARQVSEPYVYFDVVGIHLINGVFEIINECDNFSGIVRKGERMEHADYYLKLKYKNKLRPNGTNASNAIDNT